MPSQSDVEALRRALNAISARSKADLARIWAGLDTTDIRAVRRALEVVWPDLLATYGDMAATISADVFEVWAEDLGLRPKVVLVRPVDAPRAVARMGWAIGQPEALGSLTVILDELVKQPGRRTIQRSAEASGGGWARVPTGSETCAFCRMLASRGGRPALPPEMGQTALIRERVTPAQRAEYEARGGKAWLVQALARKPRQKKGGEA